MEEEKLIRNGVFAIDQSKVLARNIVNYLNEKPLETYKQRKKYLAIIAMDKNRGLLTYGNLLMFGKWTLKLKAYIDNKYMKKLKK
jgi:NADH dehydrogenase FAD-containing subunit